MPCISRAFFVFDQRSKLSLGVFSGAFIPLNIVEKRSFCVILWSFHRNRGITFVLFCRFLHQICTNNYSSLGCEATSLEWMSRTPRNRVGNFGKGCSIFLMNHPQGVVLFSFYSLATIIRQLSPEVYIPVVEWGSSTTGGVVLCGKYSIY